MLDDAWGKNAYADVIVNGTPIYRYHNYKKKNKQCKLYLGTKYFIVNKDFIKNQKKNFNAIKPRYYQITISMGGSDPDDLTSLVTRSLLNLDHMKLKIILGPMYVHRNRLHSLIKNKKNIQLITTPTKIWNIFSKSDIVISNAGNTLFELAIMRIPTVCISAVNHQILYAKKFSSQGFSIDLGFWKKVKEKTIFNAVKSLMDDKQLRKKVSFYGPNIVDGKGFIRFKQIVSQLESTN